MDKELVKQELNEITLPETGWGIGDEIEASDLLPSRIVLMQPTSKLVSKGKAIAGEFRDTITNKLYGNTSKSFEVIVFHFERWLITLENGKFIGIVPWEVKKHALLRWKEVIDGITIENRPQYIFYCMVCEETMQDEMFKTFALQGMSYKKGKQICTMFAPLKFSNTPSASITLRIDSSQVENEKGLFYVWEIEKGRETTNKEKEITYKWFRLRQQSSVSILPDANSVEEELEEEHNTSKIKTETSLAEDDIVF